MHTEIPVHAEVYCTDGLCGVSTLVVINPATRQVTHLVVRGRGWMDEEHMVAIGEVVETTANVVHLRCSKDELAEMKRFLRGEHRPGEIPFLSYGPDDYMMWPYVWPDDGILLQEHDHVPPDELAVHRGTHVNATDGRVGRVDEFLVDPQDGQVTHLVLREGHLWGQKDVTIPVSQIERIGGDTVYLRLDKEHIKALPAIPVHRGM
jgi:sporulation protein YlmC with PRC-barrel domain